MTAQDPQPPNGTDRDGWLATHAEDADPVTIDGAAPDPLDVLAALGDDQVAVLALVEVLDGAPDAAQLLAEAARVLRTDGRLLVVHRLAGSGATEPRPLSTPLALLRALDGAFTPHDLTLTDGDLRVAATVADHDRRAGDDGAVTALLAGAQEQAEAAWLATAEAAHRAEQEGRGLTERLEGLHPAIRHRSALAADRRRLERDLQRTVDAASKQLSEISFQRDEARWKLASLRARRWQRLGSVIAAALRSRKALLLLPLRIWQVLTGPAEPPALPRPSRKKVSVSLPDDVPVVAGMQPRALEPSVPVAVADLRVAGIADTFTRACLEPEVELVTFTPDGWRDVLERRPPHLLFVESAWQGNDGSWQYRIGQYDDVLSVGHPDLAALTAWCRKRDIPTVFWNKEDPIHFGRFRRASTLFDVVLTTDADCTDEYAKLLLQSAEVVEALPFAAQPVLHHPTGSMGPRDPRPVFAGTYYRNRHEDRKRSLEQLLDAALPFGLVIYDRTHGDGDPSTGFPDRFEPHIAGGVPYERMVQLYRDHRVFLNANSVVDSPTMFSRRVFELLACGTPVVSTPSRGLELLLGDVVDIVDDADSAAAAIGRLQEDDGWWRARSLAGLQHVMAAHTYADRLAQVARWCGYDVVADRDAVISALRPSSGAPTPGGVEVSLVAEDVAGDPTGAATRTVSLTGGDEVARYRELADLAPTAWVLVGEEAPSAVDVARLATARRYTTAQVIGTAIDGGPSHRYVDRLGTGPTLVRRELVARHGWSSDPATLEGVLDAARAGGALLYATATR